MAPIHIEFDKFEFQEITGAGPVESWNLPVMASTSGVTD
jgi:hypothetical protein